MFMAGSQDGHLYEPHYKERGGLLWSPSSNDQSFRGCCSLTDSFPRFTAAQGEDVVDPCTCESHNSHVIPSRPMPLFCSRSCDNDRTWQSWLETSLQCCHSLLARLQRSEGLGREAQWG